MTKIQSSRQRGFTLIEMLIALLMSSVLLAGMIAAYTSCTNYYRDMQLRSITNEKARIALESMAYDIRNIAAGMPISQKNFLPGSTLSVGSGTPVLEKPTLPILLDADNEQFTIRLNQRGAMTVLTDDFHPDIRYDFFVYNSAGCQGGDKVYLSNMTQGKEEELFGVVVSVSDNHINLKNNLAYSPNAIFPKGSSIHHVSEVTYENGDKGILRADEHVVATICDHAQFQVEYLNESGTVIPLPLTETAIRDSLAIIRITVTVTPDIPLSDGTKYVGTASEKIMLRNLVLTRLS